MNKYLTVAKEVNSKKFYFAEVFAPSMFVALYKSAIDLEKKVISETANTDCKIVFDSITLIEENASR